MRVLFSIMLWLLPILAFTQNGPEYKSSDKKGFMFGLGVGGGILRLSVHDTIQESYSTTLPNIKIGYRFTDKLAILAILPGANYKYHGKSRGFEGFIIAGQYWVKENWWILGGTGLAFDAPAFYTVKDPAKAGFYTGFPAFTLGTGYEVWHKGRFTLDFQYRLFYGKSDLPEHSQREGLSNMFIIGMNWY